MKNLLKKLVPNGSDHTLEVPKYEGDVANVQIVSSIATDDGNATQTIVVHAPSARMTKTEALVHAAWIVALADHSENFEEFRRVLKAVLET